MVRMTHIISSLFCLSLSLTRATGGNSGAAAARTTSRRLDEGGAGGAGFLQYDRCLRVKIPSNNDDDGNAYFYNGAYRSQSMPYVAYTYCNKGCGQCSEDEVATFVAPLVDVVEEQVEYTAGYCQECAQQCRRRRLEDGGDADDFGWYSVDCNTCYNQCQTYIKQTYGGNDESEYLACQEAFMDDDGIQYYSGPRCSSSGQLEIGLFYDEDCTIKKEDVSGYSSNYAYNTFTAMQSVCMDCQDGVCNNIVENLQCVNGMNINGDVDDSEMKVCKAYKKASKQWQYAKAKGKSKAPFVIFAVALLTIFFFLSYVYYVRHKNAASQAKEALDVSADASAKADYAEMT